MVTPRAITSIPSVITNGCSRPRVMPSPLIAPTSPPAATASTIAMGHGTPPTDAVAKVIAAKPRIEPTDRSMPAVRITNVIPTPRIPTIAACRATLAMLPGARKLGSSSVPTITSTISASRIPLPRRTRSS